MYERLNTQFAQNHPVPQYELHERRSTEQAKLGVRAIIQKALNQEREVVLVFVDLRRA